MKLTEGEDAAFGRGSRSVPVLVLLLLTAAVLRFAGLDSPGFKIFDEFYYATDACTYVTEGQFFCGIQEATTEHPPAAKWLMAAGVWMFTPTPFGSRVMVALFGTLSVGVLFLIARRLLRSVMGAAIAALLLALDPLHLVVSRTALLDVFGSFFILLALLCILNDLARRSGGDGESGASPQHRLWRPAAGASIGLAIASKWTALPMLVVVIGLALGGAVRHARDRGSDRPWRAGLRNEAGSVAIYLLLVPAVIYALTYLGRLEGDLLAAPWSEGSWSRALLGRQVDMFRYHFDLRRHFAGDLAPFHSSPAWSWPLIQRPIPFAFAVRGGSYREVLALGNPLTWWPGLLAAVVGIRTALRGHQRFTVIVIWAGLAGTYLFWLVPGPNVTNLFIYYFLPAVPFLYLASGAASMSIARSSGGRVVLVAYLALVIASFVFLYPVLTWRPLSPDAWRSRVPFSQCDPYNVGDKEVLAGYPYPADDLVGRPIPAYPEGSPGEEHVPLLTTRDGWCWR